jgi:hypothetical protein
MVTEKDDVRLMLVAIITPRRAPVEPLLED